MDDVVRVHASSGTTGKQTVVGYTRNDLALWGEVMARTFTAGGVTKKDIGHISYGYGLFTGGLGARTAAAETNQLLTNPVSTGNTNRQIQILRDFGCSFICCTPSYALYRRRLNRWASIRPRCRCGSAFSAPSRGRKICGAKLKTA